MERGPGRTFVEVSERDFLKCWWRRRKIHIKWISLFGAVVLPVVLAWSASTVEISLQEVLVLLIADPVLIVVAYLKGNEAARLNRFGILEEGIAPPRKPKSYSKVKGRVVVPYETVGSIEYKVVGTGRFPNSHYGAVLHLRNEEEFEFDATEIFAQSRWKEEIVAKAQPLLENLAKQLNSWRDGGGKGHFSFSPEKTVPHV